MSHVEFEKRIADEIFFVLNDLVGSGFAHEFMRLHAQLLNSRDNGTYQEESDISDKIKIDAGVVKAISDLKDGKVTKKEFFEKLNSLNTTISFDIKDFIEQEFFMPNEDDTDTSDSATVDLKSAIMGTDIGKKLFEHIA